MRLVIKRGFKAAMIALVHMRTLKYTTDASAYRVTPVLLVKRWYHFTPMSVLS